MFWVPFPFEMAPPPLCLFTPCLYTVARLHSLMGDGAAWVAPKSYDSTETLALYIKYTLYLSQIFFLIFFHLYRIWNSNGDISLKEHFEKSNFSRVLILRRTITFCPYIWILSRDTVPLIYLFWFRRAEKENNRFIGGQVVSHRLFSRLCLLCGHEI